MFCLTKPSRFFWIKRNKNLGNFCRFTVLIGVFSVVSLSSNAAVVNPALNSDNVNLKPVNNALVSHEHDVMMDKQSTQQQFIKASISKANQLELSLHPTWLRMYYFYKTEAKDANSTESDSIKGALSYIQYRSKIDSPEFFVSSLTQNKNTSNQINKPNPQVEIEAFIAQLIKESGLKASKADTKVTSYNLACRFPARTHWISTQLNLNLPVQHCPKLDAWMQQLDPQQLSVVFAEAYLDKPVSAFGHTLMLIDSTASLDHPEAIDKAHALNVTVGGDSNDSFAVYTVKSMTGAYPNEVTIKPYPHQLSNYLQVDNRDVWTYKLNLSKAEVQQIIRHVWETKDLNLPYYFTLDNCASEILRYIDIVRPEGNLLERFKFAVVPSDIVRLLDYEGIILQHSYIPANTTLAQAKLNNSQLKHLPSSSIKANQKLTKTDLVPSNNNIIDAHARQRVAIGIGTQDIASLMSVNTGGQLQTNAQDTRRYVSLAYRGGFNGPLDPPRGYPQNFHLEAGSIELRFYEEAKPNLNNKSSYNHEHHDRVELQSLTVLQGRSFNPINTAKSKPSKLSSWGVNLQAIQINDGSLENGSANHLVGSTTYEKGVSMAFGEPKSQSGELPPHHCYTFGALNAQVGKGISNGYRAGAGINAGCRWLIHQQLRMNAEIKLPYWYHGDINTRHTNNSYWQPIATIKAQYDFNKNNGIRLEGEHHLLDRIEGDSNIKLSYVKYF